MVKWCPSTPRCGNAIQAEHDKLCEVECSCGRQFCFSCMSQAHSPCSCLMWELWRKKCRDESETVIWITVYTELSQMFQTCGKEWWMQSRKVYLWAVFLLVMWWSYGK